MGGSTDVGNVTRVAEGAAVGPGVARSGAGVIVSLATMSLAAEH